jgi:hypothetical protein
MNTTGRLPDLSLALDGSLLLTAAIIGFFRMIDRKDSEQMAEIERVFGLTTEAFWRAVRALHDAEAVDLYEDEVVKVADQVLATYLLFIAMFRELSSPFDWCSSISSRGLGVG